MDDACAMCNVKSPRNLNRDPEDLRRAASVSSGAYRRGSVPRGILHDEEQHRLLVRSVGIRRVANIVQPADVRMGQRRDRLGFPFEPQAGIRIERDARRQDFEGHRAVEADVTCSVEPRPYRRRRSVPPIWSGPRRAPGERPISGFGRDYMRGFQEFEESSKSSKSSRGSEGVRGGRRVRRVRRRSTAEPQSRVDPSVPSHGRKRHRA